MLLKYISSFILVCIVLNISFAQEASLHYSLTSQGFYTTTNHVPFWMYANQFGSVPSPGPSVSFLGKVGKDYNLKKKSLVDWSFSLEGRTNIGSNSKLLLIEGYAKGKLSIFELTAGREKNVIGLIDSTLSSGSIALSGNALGIPKISLSISEFYTLPILWKLFAIKGKVEQGWLGDISIDFANKNEKLNGYFHLLSAYGRIGQPSAKLKIYGGINHMVIWADEQKIFGDEFTISPKETLYYVVTGKKVIGSRYISKIGNQLGSVDIGFDYSFNNFRLFVYRQHFYDKGAIRYLANLRDGLNGLSFTNLNSATGQLHWRKLVLEVLYSKNQAGESWSKWTPSGPEQYYNHTVYIDGYSYNGMGLGNPFITPRHMAREGQAYSDQDFFINNRIFLIHTGIEVEKSNWNFLGKFSYSRNYGTYWTSDTEYFWFNNTRRPHNAQNNIFKEVGQYSTVIRGVKNLSNGIKVGTSLAIDVGNLLPTSFGFTIDIKKSFGTSTTSKSL